MSNDEPVFADEPAAKKGMSTTAKVVLVMLGVGGVALLLCCGGLFGAGVWLRRTVEQAQVTNPVQVRELADQIVSIQLPEQYVPQQGLQLPMLGMRMVTFVRPDQSGAQVMLMENTMGANPADPVQREQMLKQIETQQGIQGSQLKDSELREIEVAGQKVSFQFGTININGTEVRQAMGFVPLQKGVVLVVITVPLDSYKQEEVIAILQSIGEPELTGTGSPAGSPTGEPPPPQGPVTTPAPAGTATPDTPPPVDQPVEAEQPEPATVPQ
jgi:hypothetical protein